ncbi:MAG: hypothetical protein JWN45_442 [Acidobacteriaceae bacterium]|nr:hypothetical protein [Acidobacteriaceae bacterium]
MNCFRLVRKAVSSSLLLTAFVASAPAQAAPKAEASCRAAVQKFYDWYVPEVFREKQTWAAKSALESKEFAFSPELRKSLREDFAASAANKSEIVGLDFDPFLASQDPAHKYVVDKVLVKDGHCRADVYGVESGKKAKKPDVRPELQLRGKTWVFVDFHYPQENGSLLSILRELRKDRQRKPGS